MEKLGMERPASCSPAYTRREELAHTLSHGLGFLGAAIGSIVLLALTFKHSSILDIVGVSVFGITLTLLYAVSTLYHVLPVSGSKRVLQKLDHAAIYLLISGTYTPFILIKMQTTMGWALLALVWALAVIGIGQEFLRNSPTRKISLGLYLVMGWLAVFALKPLLDTVEPTGVLLLVLGGVTYSLGIIFYAWNRLPYNHAVWHGFVLGGSALHFASVIGFVI